MLTAVTHPDRLTAADVLDSVFHGNDLSSGYGKLERCSFHVVSQGVEPRWIIIGSPNMALPVLRSWAPWKMGSRMRWRAVRIAAASNTLPLIPGIENGTLEIDTSYWRASLPEFPDGWSAVIHVGSFSHTRKAILFLIADGERIICAAKVPLVAGASEAILNEGEMLDSLRPYDYVPRVLFRDRSRGVVAQSWLEGRPVSREFTDAHLHLLESLSCPGAYERVSDQASEIASGLESTDLPFDRSVLARGMEFLDYDLPLVRFVEHRDFAPWNLKWIRNGVLGLLDWEWAVPDGLPWQDICRYFYLDDVHFQGKGQVWQALTSNERLLIYRRRYEIPSDALPALTMRYLLREFLMEWKAGNNWLAEYAFCQIQILSELCSPVRG